MKLRGAALGYLEKHNEAPFKFWVENRNSGKLRLIDLCDVLYALYLIGCDSYVSDRSKVDFVDVVAQKRLPANLNFSYGKALNIHLTAYIFGALNLLEIDSDLLQEKLFQNHSWKLHKLFDSQINLPRWPSHLSHHSWRVSHWIGGTLSIFHSLWNLCPSLAAVNQVPTIDSILVHCDDLIDSRTGLLRAYKSDLAQSAFRSLYKFRHDPDAADIGGTVHIHWLNYVANRIPYKSQKQLYVRAWKILQRRPFIEAVPYCLDFDVVQIVRTSIPDDPGSKRAFRQRAQYLMEDIRRFYISGLNRSYSLHKLPGGLAAIHECAMATDQHVIHGLGIEPVDIIKKAYWI